MSFKDTLVERNADDPRRIDVLVPAEFVAQFRAIGDLTKNFLRDARRRRYLAQLRRIHRNAMRRRGLRPIGAALWPQRLGYSANSTLPKTSDMQDIPITRLKVSRPSSIDG